MQIKTPGKIGLVVLVVAGLFAGKVLYWDKRPQEAKAAATIGRVAIPDAPGASLSGNAPFLPLPDSKESVNGGNRSRIQVMAWNSQFPLMYANGGINTSVGSLFDKAKLQVEIIRQDDCNKTIADMVKFASDYKNNPNTPGFYAALMGDGMPAFFASLEKELAPLGPEYKAIGIYTMGKSYGEDKLMGPPDWKQDPKNALGKTVACFLRDGDMNILLKWAGDNGLKVNPDETTYDPNAINLIAANDFIDAGNKYITDYKEKRKLIVNGKKIAKDTTVGVDGVATWTPVDVTIAEKKGGLVSIADTKQYASQMPNLLFTIKKYANDHRSDVESMISALAQAGDQVRSFTQAKAFAAEVSAKVYGENDGKYWLKYYDGVKTKDIQGYIVNLGGSMAFNLADAANMLGLGTDRIDRYKAVYTTFGDILVKMYPEIMPTYPAYNTVIDKSFLNSVLSNNPELLEGKPIQVSYSNEITNQVSSRSYQIQFQTGSATILDASFPVLEEIMKSAIVAEGLKLGVYGHTDNVGNEISNKTLSESRAASVKNYLLKRGMNPDRVETAGYGSSQPIASNDSPDGRARNRRVQIVLGE